MQKIFITGGFGYIGSKLAMEAMAKGISVFIFDSIFYKQDYKEILRKIESKKSGNSKCDFLIGDIRNTDLLKESIKKFKPNFIFHFAELVGIHICNENPAYTEEINFHSSKRVIDIAEELNIPIIYNSTSSLYGNSNKFQLLKEGETFGQITDNYCKNKLEMEKYILYKLKNDSDLKIIVLRLATVSGISPRMRLELLPNHFTYCAVSKHLIKVSEPESYRAHIDVLDIVNAYFSIISNTKWPNVIYNLGHYNMQKIEIAKEIALIVDCKIQEVSNLGDPRNLQIDSEAFNRDFNFIPNVQFKDTIRNTAEWIASNLDEVEKTNFTGVINSPLNQWLKII